MSSHALPNWPLETLAERARDDVRAYTAFAAKATTDGFHIILGAAFARMLQDPLATEQGLESSDWRVRIAAAWLVATHWAPHAPFVPLCIRVAFHDGDPLVRGAAIIGISRIHDLVDDTTGLVDKVLHMISGEIDMCLRVFAKARLDDKGSWAKTVCDDKLRGLAGPLLPRLLESREVADAYLGDPDPCLRCAAIFVVMSYWKPTEAFARRCEEVLRTDTDTRVREHAMACVSSYYRGSGNEVVAGTFARLVMDDSLEARLRKKAYTALLRVTGSRTVEVIRMCSGFRFPEDVDWALVRSFAPGATGSASAE